MADNNENLNDVELDEGQKKRLVDHLLKNMNTAATYQDEQHPGVSKLDTKNMSMEDMDAARNFLRRDNASQDVLGQARATAGFDPAEMEASSKMAQEVASKNMLDNTFKKPAAKKREEKQKQKEEKVQRKLASEEPKELSESVPDLGESKPKEDNSSEDASNQAYLAAQQAANTNQLGANILRNTNLINQGLTLSPISQANAEAQEKSANAPVEAFQGMQQNRLNQMKIASSGLELKNDKMMNDPSSDISKTSRQVLKQFGIDVPETTSAKVLKESGVNLGSLLGIKEQAELRQQNSELNRDLKNQGKGIQINRQMGALVGRVNNDPVMKGSLQNLTSLQKSNSLLNNPNVKLTSQALSDAENDIASALSLRGMGATEGKIKRTELIDLNRKIAEFKQEYGNNIQDLRKQAPELVEQIKKLNNALLEDYQTTIHDRKNDLADEYGALYGGEPEYDKRIQAYKDLNEQKYKQSREPKSEPRVTLISPDGRRGTVPVSKVKEALSNGFTLAPHEPPEGM